MPNIIIHNKMKQKQGRSFQIMGIIFACRQHKTFLENIKVSKNFIYYTKNAFPT